MQKTQVDKQAAGRAAHAEPQISDKKDDRDARSSPKVSVESRLSRDVPNRDKQEHHFLKEEMKRERMLITVSQEPAALPKQVLDQVKNKTPAVGNDGGGDGGKSAEDSGEEEKSGKKSKTKSDGAKKKDAEKKKLHKAKKKKSKKKKDKRKS